MVGDVRRQQQSIQRQAALLLSYCFPRSPMSEEKIVPPVQSCPVAPFALPQSRESGQEVVTSNGELLYKIIVLVLILRVQNDNSKEARDWDVWVYHCISSLLLRSFLSKGEEDAFYRAVRLEFTHAESQRVLDAGNNTSTDQALSVGMRQRMEENILKEVSENASAGYPEFTYAASGGGRILECFLFGEGRLFRYCSSLNAMVVHRDGTSRFKAEAQTHLQLFCRCIHNILTEYGIPNSDPEAAKVTFLVEEQARRVTDVQSADKRPALNRVGDLLVMRNPLSGVIQCAAAAPMELMNNAEEPADGLYLRQTKVLTKQPDPLQFVLSDTENHGKCVAQLCSRVLRSLFEVEVIPLSLRGTLPLWSTSLAGYVIPLALRLLNVHDARTHYNSLCCLESILRYCSTDAVSRFYLPIAIALQRHYPVFLQPHTETGDCETLTQYLRTFVTLLVSTPYSFASSNIVSNVDFLLMRARLNVVGFPNRLAVFLFELRRLVEHAGHCGALYSREILIIALQAMESEKTNLCYSACQMLIALISNLPRFCTERYWKDICVRVLLIKRRESGTLSAYNGALKSDGGKDHTTKQGSCIRAADELVQAMAQCVNNCPYYGPANSGNVVSLTTSLNLAAEAVV